MRKKSSWKEKFSRDDFLQSFEKLGPIHASVNSAQYSLAWFVEHFFVSASGRPLILRPFQSVMLDMLWYKKFPMILACRGAGKCGSGTTLVQVSDGLYRFDELIDPNAPEMTRIPIQMDAIGENGANPIGYAWNNGWRNTKKVKTAFGFEIEVTFEHKLRVADDGSIKWRESQDIKIGDAMPVVRTDYAFGSDTTLSEDYGWFLGATIGDGMVSQLSQVLLTNIDADIIDEWSCIGSEWSDKEVVHRPSRPDHIIYKTAFNRYLNETIGLKYAKAHDKQIPLLVRRSPAKIVAAFLSGLFDTDGGMTKRCFEYSTVSEELSRQVQTCLLAFGILSKRREKMVKYNGGLNKTFIITIEGANNLSILKEKIGFRCRRKQAQLIELCAKNSNPNKDVIPHELIKSKLLKLSKKFRSLVTIGGHEYCKERQWLAPSKIKSSEMTYAKLAQILEHTKEIADESVWRELKDIADRRYFYDRVVSVEDGNCQTFDIHVPNDHTFIANGFISHNTFMLAVYALLRAILIPGTKVVIAGAGYRQAKLVFRYIDDLYKASPIVQEACKDGGGPKYGSDGASLRVGLSTIMAIPIGDGEKIRGLRANVLIADEFGSIPEQTFEIVLKPFTSVHANPAQRAAIAGVVRRLQDAKADPELIKCIENLQDFGNQIVMSGTATHRHNHFYKRYKAYRNFIDSCGDIAKFTEALQEQQLEISSGMPSIMTEIEARRLSTNWHQYAIYQLPYRGIDDEFLDMDQILSDKALFPKDRFDREYNAEFPEDSDGFIKRSKIEAATPRRAIDGSGGDPVHVEIFGDPREYYVMGLDPARWNDNFGLVILKLTERGREFVYSDAWAKTDWDVSVQKIRDVCRRFNIAYICIDKEGGGDFVRKLLCSKNDSSGKEVPPEDLIWLIPEQLENKSDMAAPGRKILEMVNFTTWTPKAAHSLEANIHQMRLLFPGPPNGTDSIVRQYKRYSGVENVSSELEEELSRMLWGAEEWESGGRSGRRIGVFEHIHECINETCNIVKEVTVNGVERFILPKLQNQSEGLDVRRRDRFSALLLANYAADVYLGHGHRRHSVTPGDSNVSNRSSLGGRGYKRRGSAVWFNPNRHP